MKKIIFIFTLILITTSLYSQTGWVFQNSGTNARLNHVRFYTTSTGFAVGTGGTVLRTTNGGTNWTVLNAGIYNNINSVWPYYSYIWIVGDSGLIKYSNNNGDTWNLISPTTTLDLYSINCINNFTGYIVGGKSSTLEHIFLKTVDGGTVWAPIASGTGILFNCISFLDPNTGWACGTGGAIVKTTNAGANFSPTTTGISDNLRSVFFFDANTGYACGDNGRIIYTSNGGTNWQISNSGITSSLYSIMYKPGVTNPYVYAAGSNGVILSSTNNGVSWNRQISNTSRNLQGLFFVDNNTGWVVGDTGTVIKTINGGVTLASYTYHKSNVNKTIPIGTDVFDTIKTGIIPTGSILDVNVFIDTILYTPVGGLELQFSHLGTSCMLVSHTGGTGSNFINTTFNDSASVSITTGTPPFTGVYKPLGTLSVFNNLAPEGDWIIKILAASFANHPELTGVIKSYGMTINYNVNIDVKQISSIVPDKYILYQNYPNPFNPSTKIRFDIPSVGSRLALNTTLKIFDILGREVTTLVNDNLKPGTYEVGFDGSFLSSGIYFYKITAGDFSETKRMLIIK